MAETEKKSDCSKMKEVFINCQSGHHSQASLIKTLTKMYQSENSEKFLAEFIDLVKHFLIVFKREPAVERAIDLIAKFSTSLQTPASLKKDDEVENKDTSECPLETSYQEDMHPFLLQLFRFLLKNHNARDKAVRFRVCQLINRLFTSLGDDAAIDDELYESVYVSMQCRLRDKFPIVRVHAVLALARLQDPSDPECPIIAAFKYMLEYDINADVRRAVLSSIAATTRTVGVVLDRTRDSKDSVRRLAYQVIAEKVHVRALTIAQRVRVLRQGLNDRSETVKESCITHLVKAWLTTYSGNKLNLIGLLDVENSLETVQQLLGLLFKKSTPDELIAEIDFLDDDHVIRIDRLTCESSLYWRCLGEHMRSLGAKADEYIDKMIPSGVAYAKYLRGIMERMTNEQRVDEQLKNEFILQQLVSQIAALDLTDEVNRKHIIHVLRDLLLSDCVTHSIVSCVLSRYSQLNTDSDTFIASIAEVIAEIREPITVENQPMGREERRQIDLKLAAIRVQLNQARDELDECVQKQEFQRAAELKQKVVDLEASRQTLIKESLPQSQEVRVEKTDPQTLLKCLSLLSELLSEARFKKLTPSLQTLIEVLILPGIQNADPAVRNQAAKALGLCCLRSVDLARERIILLLQISRMDQETVKLTALRAIFDLLHFYGLEVFKVEPTVDKDKDTSAGDDDEGKNDSSDEFDDLTSENSSEPRQMEKTDFGADILALVTDLLDSSSSEVRTLCAEGYAKLLLAGRVVSPSLLSRLLLLWYNPLTEDDTRLRHCIGTFLPVYAFASRRNQELVADAIMPTLRALFDAPATSPLAEVKVANVAELLVELTDVRHQMAAVPVKDSLADESPHDNVAVKIANEILSNPNSIDVRVLVKTLCLLHVTPTNESVLKDLRVLCKRMLKEIKDKLCTRPLEKFTRSIRDMLQQLKTDGAHAANQSLLTDSDDELSSSKMQQNDDGNASSVLSRTLNNSNGRNTSLKLSQRGMKKLMTHSRLSPSGENCSISDVDTENDDTFVSPQARPPPRASAINATLQNRKAVESPDDRASGDSDFETPARPVRAAAAASIASAKAAPRTRSTASKRRRSPLTDQSN